MVAEWEGENLTVWASTQGVFPQRQGMAQPLGIPATNIRVITQFMGGGFGSKLQAGGESIIAARLARLASVPVKVALDRKEEHLDTGNRPSAGAHIKAGVAADGRLTAYQADSFGTGGAGQGVGNLPIPYIYIFGSGPNPNDNVRRTHRDVYINAGTQRPMRAPGHPQACFLTEILMDELADRVRMDPVEFRVKNSPADAPNARYRSYLPEGAKLFGWDKRHPTGDPAAGPDQDGLWLRRPYVGRRRQRHPGALRHPPGWQRRHEVRHAGHRHGHADDRRDRHRRDAGPARSAR